MKISTFTFRIFLGLALIFTVTKNSSATIYIINNVLNAAQEVPTNTSTGTGTVTGTYNSVTKLLTYTVTFTGLTGTTTQGHFHSPALPGANAGVVIGYTGLPLNVTSGTYSSSATLSAALDTQLVNGYFYANIHTNFRTGGEIRGQVTPYTMDLTTLIQGFYDNVSNTMIRDTVTVNLRNATSPFATVATTKGYLDANGKVSLGFPNATSGTNYYIQILHRNALETWSGSTVAFTLHYSSYDFTTSASQGYGSNLILKGSKYCNYSGDVNQDGTIDISDLQDIDNDGFNFVSGYVPTDVNGDNFVDVSDAGIAENNAFNFVSVMRP
jgi:CHRD domain